MIIAINTRPVYTAGQEEKNLFIKEIVTRLALEHSNHQFLIITDGTMNIAWGNNKNINFISVGPSPKQSLRLSFWYDHTLPALLRKHKADIVLHDTGACALRGSIPQVMIINDLDHVLHPAGLPANLLRWFNKRASLSYKKANALTTTDTFLQTILIDKFQQERSLINVIYPAARELFQPVDWVNKEKIKELHTEGREFFLYSGEIGSSNSLIDLLKAFSFFKKRQKSSMQLVITGSAGEGYSAFTDSLSTFKFRNEVKLVKAPGPEQLAQITAAAYVMVYPTKRAHPSTPLLEAMQCGVPIITSAIDQLPEICGEAALYANPTDFNDLAEKMMLLFKDEQKHGLLSKAGREKASVLNWDAASQMLWQLIEKTAER